MSPTSSMIHVGCEERQDTHRTIMILVLIFEVCGK